MRWGRGSVLEPTLCQEGAGTPGAQETEVWGGVEEWGGGRRGSAPPSRGARTQDPRWEILQIEYAPSFVHSLMDLLIIHIKTQPFRESREEKEKAFTCHISVKTNYSEVTKLTETAMRKAAQ